VFFSSHSSSFRHLRRLPDVRSGIVFDLPIGRRGGFVDAIDRLGDVLLVPSGSFRGRSCAKTCYSEEKEIELYILYHSVKETHTVRNAFTKG